MSRVAEFIALIDEPENPALEGESPLDDAVFRLMVQLAYSDGVLQDDEVMLLARLQPQLDRAAVVQWAEQLNQEGFRIADLAPQIQDPVERWDTVRLAARMVCMDGDIAEEEVVLLQELVASYGLSSQAHHRAINEVVAAGGPISEDRVLGSLRNMLWRMVTPTREEPISTLAAVIPPHSCHVATMWVGEEEVAALYTEGIAAVFESGPQFVCWEEILTYTRVPVPGASFHLHTAQQHLKMADPRMRDIGKLLDYLYGREELPEA